MKTIELLLPWPPSVNSMYRPGNGRIYKTREAKLYAKDTSWLLKSQVMKQDTPELPISDRVQVSMQCYPPDNRRRDDDNIQKAIGDCLMTAGIIKDDSQIKRRIIDMEEPKNDGFIELWIDKL